MPRTPLATPACLGLPFGLATALEGLIFGILRYLELNNFTGLIIHSSTVPMWSKEQPSMTFDRNL